MVGYRSTAPERSPPTWGKRGAAGVEVGQNEIDFGRRHDALPDSSHTWDLRSPTSLQTQRTLHSITGGIGAITRR
jgi:hypothetical protein